MILYTVVVARKWSWRYRNKTMPVTPLHLGPGAVLKAALGRRMSLTVFAFCQITMDLEVLARMALGVQQLHGFTNTVLGATVLLVPSVFVGRLVCQAFLRWWNSRLSPRQARWMRVDPVVPWKAAWIGGTLGVYSHVFLDASMHPDAHPWAPLSSVNPLVGLLSSDALNGLCLGSLLVVVFLMGTQKIRKMRNGSPVVGDDGRSVQQR